MRGLPHTGQNFKIENFEARFCDMLQCEPYSTQVTLHMCPPSVIKCSICSHMLSVCLDTRTCSDRDHWLKARVASEKSAPSDRRETGKFYTLVPSSNPTDGNPLTSPKTTRWRVLRLIIQTKREYKPKKDWTCVCNSFKYS